MALMSVIIISVILLLIASTLSFTGFSGRLNILDSEYKERSLALAEACLDMVLLKLAIDPTYSGGPPDVNVGTNKCSILNFDNPNLFDPTIIEIKTKATFQKAVTNLRIKVLKVDLSFVSFEEIS